MRKSSAATSWRCSGPLSRALGAIALVAEIRRCRLMSVGEAGRNVARHAVAVNADHTIAAFLGHGWHLVSQVAPEDTAEHLDVGVLRDQYVDVADDRVGLDVDLGGRALVL